MAPKPEEQKTETTLTTRIRINIPGSRPIPPVIMRTPVGDEAGAASGPAAVPAPPAAAKNTPAAGSGAPAARQSADGKPALPRRPEPSAAPARQEAERPASKDKTSDWFAPRKSSPGTPPAGAGRRPQASGGGSVPPLPQRQKQGPPPAAPAAPVDDWPVGPTASQATPAPPAPTVTGTPSWQGASSGMPADAQGAPKPVDDWPGGSASGTTGTTPWQPDTSAAQADDWPGGSSTTSATPWPAEGVAGTGEQRPTGPVDDWPGASASGTTGATPWQAETPAGHVDDWPGGSSTTAATPWPADGAAAAPAAPVDDWPVGPSGSPAASGPSGSTTGATPWQGAPSGMPSDAQGAPKPVDDWPGGSASGTTGTTPWQADTSTARGARGAQTDDWPGGASVSGTTGTTPWPGGPADASTTGATPAPWAGDPMATGTNPVVAGTPQATPAVPPPGPGASAGAAPWTGAPDTTQQFPAPTAGQGNAFPGGAAFAPGRTDTPREGVPRVPAPSTGAQSAPRGPKGPQGTQAPGNGQQQTKAPKAPKNGGKGGKKGGQKAPAAPGGTSETLVSGVPVVPPPGPGKKAGPVDSGAPRVAVPKPKVPAPGGAPAPAASAPKSAPKKAAKKKGRSKVVLLGGAVVALAGVAYGAGLLLDHADVPNGTTVLGVGIGGSSKEQAVQKLDSALGGRATDPLKVSIGGKEAELKPSVAGLSIDTQATVRAAAGRDYNPLTVIPSLIGGTRKAEATIGADEEKIAAALKTLAGESGGAKDGTIVFEPGKAVPVYGKPYVGLDTDKAVAAVAQAYRDRAATGENKTVELPSAQQQPKVDKAEVDRVMNAFAKPAMSGLVTIQTDPAHSIQFGPDRSLPKILAVKEVNGKLEEHYNLEALKELYGTKFNGVTIQRGNGSKTPVQPQDVVVALRKALLGKTPAERVGVIPVNGS
ncbi:hypothetical protein M1P56_28975 [Streptomyces sp. HU2014]|uniref:hypothetical protein n=1 Tax=Streptomyces sp. HU2014 TaxID=2939414 RepID=UPI00200EE885|nr:hypothetical protein [Streptomyces sp. HU2014]UQI48076.1 hypothetical protein M1P56_28975 [Streptomyces sp. HU2014]